MLTIHDFANATYEPWPGATKLPEGVSWIDAHSPSPEEVEFLRHSLGVEPPTLAKMSEIESSSRFYRLGEALCVTIPLPKREIGNGVVSHPVALIVTARALLSVRYEALRPCEPEYLAAIGADRSLPGGFGALAAVVDSIVDHLADELENVTVALAGFSKTIFARPTDRRAMGLRGEVLQGAIIELGHKREFTSLIEETLLTLERLGPFLAAEANAALTPEVKSRFKRIGRDVASLSAHENRLSEKIQFQLDASLGLISVEQNDIFKVLTMVSVIGIPPTLFASMYGMNFKNIPEYDWTWGYQWGLFLIIGSALLPLLWFKWRRWW